MKAIIPVAGVGTRLRPHTYTQPKPLIPVGGKPLIASIIDQLVDAEIKEFVVFSTNSPRQALSAQSIQWMAFCA